MRPAVTSTVDILHLGVPAVRTPQGLRALSKGRPIEPASVQRYLEGTFGDALDDVTWGRSPIFPEIAEIALRPQIAKVGGG
jgi:hypothetical protein